VEAALEAAGVSPLAACPLGSLSGGELQMAWLALALAQEPRVLLLDEPTTSLDVQHQVEAMGLLRRLNREEGLTVVVVLHDLQLAAQFTDRVLALRHGRLEFDGPTGRVFTPPALERVFGVPMTVFPHPETGEPIALPSHSATSAISSRG
jgi:iron complex transport system ATP-binding protein